MQEPEQKNNPSETLTDVGETAAEFGLDMVIETAFEGVTAVADGALGIAGEVIGGALDTI